MEEGAQEDAEEGALHLATHVFIPALSLLLDDNTFSLSECSTSGLPVVQIVDLKPLVVGSVGPEAPDWTISPVD